MNKLSQDLKQSLYADCSKAQRCKACHIMQQGAYFLYAAVKGDERRRSGWRFSTACWTAVLFLPGRIVFHLLNRRLAVLRYQSGLEAEFRQHIGL